MLLDASPAGSQGVSQKVRVVERGERRERVDVVARQFRDSLRSGDPADISPQTLMLTHDFKVRRQVTDTAGWLTFLVDRSRREAEELEEVALVVFARAADEPGRRALRK